MGIYKTWPIMIVLLLSLSGCWDERQFKNYKVVLAAGFDEAEDNKIKSTVIIPTVEKGMEGPGNEYIQTVNSVSNTLREGRSLIDQKISEIFDASKLRVILLGDELAKQDILPLLDVFYRDPKSNLNAKLAVVKGNSEDVIRLRVGHEPRISGYISGLLEGQVKTSQSPNQNIQLICAEMMEPGEDFALPLLSLSKEEELLNYEGLALFHGQKYTGYSLNKEETLFMVLMKGEKGKVARLTVKVNEDEKQFIKNFVTINVQESKQKLKVNKKDDGFEVKVNLNIGAGIAEYPKNQLNPKAIKKLNSTLSEKLTEEAKQVIAKIQEANSDMLGIGRRLQAFHYKEWKKLNWEEEYKNISIKPTVNVKIQENGIIN